MARKVHPAAKLKTLPAEVQESLWDWFGEDPSRSLADGVDWARDQLEIETNVKRLSEWRGWYARKVEIETADSEAEELAKMLSSRGLLTSPDQIAAAANAIFLNRATKLGDAKTFVQVAGVMQRSFELTAGIEGHKDKMALGNAKLELQKRALDVKVQELELKVQQFEAREKDTKEDLKNPQLTDEERASRMRARFGV